MYPEGSIESPYKGLRALIVDPYFYPLIHRKEICLLRLKQKASPLFQRHPNPFVPKPLSKKKKCPYKAYVLPKNHKPKTSPHSRRDSSNLQHNAWGVGKSLQTLRCAAALHHRAILANSKTWRGMGFPGNPKPLEYRSYNRYQASRRAFTGFKFCVDETSCTLALGFWQAIGHHRNREGERERQ